MYRKRVSRSASKKLFRATAQRTLKVNSQGLSRGGIRL